MMFGSVRIHLRGLVGQHNPGVSDLDLSVHDPVSHGHTKEFLRAECLLVEINRGVGILENEIRSDRAISFGNWLVHFNPSFHGRMSSPRSIDLSSSNNLGLESIRGSSPENPKN